jgi:hypothetical protein
MTKHNNTDYVELGQEKWKQQEQDQNRIISKDENKTKIRNIERHQNPWPESETKQKNHIEKDKNKEA